MTPSRTAQRKGASRMADIPPEVLERLNRGEEETLTLVEWLAIDQPTLLRNIVNDVGLAHRRDELYKRAEHLGGLGISRILNGVGMILRDAMDSETEGLEIFRKLATHRSDMVRAWSALSLRAIPNTPIAKRLDAAKRYAKDSAMSVREIAWDSFRPYLAIDLEIGLQLLEEWVVDEHEGIRRCAVEASRPRGVWTGHIVELKRNPELGLHLLEPVKSDTSRYVQNAVANWLNDASKDNPEWVKDVTKRWLKKSKTPETKYIVNRAHRTIRKTTE